MHSGARSIQTRVFCLNIYSVCVFTAARYCQCVRDAEPMDLRFVVTASLLHGSIAARACCGVYREYTHTHTHITVIVVYTVLLWLVTRYRSGW
jgi:hypothetical protein